jgi:hypothetical protein
VVPLVHPLWTYGLVAPATLVPFALVTPADVDQYTLYEVAPLTAAHETVTCPLAATALTLVGAAGAPAGGVALPSLPLPPQAASADARPSASAIRVVRVIMCAPPGPAVD